MTSERAVRSIRLTDRKVVLSSDTGEDLSICAAPEANRREDGGGRRDRTDDLMLAKHALFQLSYAPSPPDGVREATR